MTLYSNISASPSEESVESFNACKAISRPVSRASPGDAGARCERATGTWLYCGSPRAAGLSHWPNPCGCRIMNGLGKRFVYVLLSDADPSRHYVGPTSNVDDRLEWHITD